MTTTDRFNPTPYLKRLKSGQDYLEVKHRLLWLRTEHPEALIETELVRLDPDAGLAVFKASVVLPEGSATGHGSETRTDFGDFIEKAETKAIGRALAALGYGTQFCEDHDLTNTDGTPHVVDSPVQPTPIRNGASPALAMLRSLARGKHMTEEDLAALAGDTFGTDADHLNTDQINQLIDMLKQKEGRRHA